MPITEPMLADALMEYLGKPPDKFKNYLAARYPNEKIDDDTEVEWVSGDGTQKKIILRIKKLSQGGGTVSENEYEITIKRT